jgi:protein-disulfide isomerase
MLFRIVIICLTLAACYAGYELWTIRTFYKTLQEPAAEFTVINPGNQPAITIVEILNYNCIPCRKAHVVLLDYAERNKDVKLVIRPVPFSNSKEDTERALAAGLQGKFADMDRAMTEYLGDFDEKFYRESAALYEIDYDRMLKDAESDEVYKLAEDNAKAAAMLNTSSVPALLIGKTLYQPEDDLTLPDLIRMVQTEQAN